MTIGRFRESLRFCIGLLATLCPSGRRRPGPSQANPYGAERRRSSSRPPGAPVRQSQGPAATQAVVRRAFIIFFFFFFLVCETPICRAAASRDVHSGRPGAAGTSFRRPASIRPTAGAAHLPRAREPSLTGTPARSARSPHLRGRANLRSSRSEASSQRVISRISERPEPAAPPLEGRGSAGRSTPPRRYAQRARRLARGPDT